MDDEHVTNAGLDRRALIKRAGIVGAGVAAWSTPMVTSLASRAYAAGSPATGCNGGICGTCSDGYEECGASGDLGFCFCGQAVDGSCACVEDYFCDSDYPTCGAGETCPSDTVCIVTCCGIAECVPVCGTNPTPGGLRALGGARASGTS